MNHTLTTASILLLASLSQAQASSCGSLNSRGGNITSRSESWAVAFEIDLRNPTYLDSLELFTRSKNKRAGRLVIEIWSTNFRGEPGARMSSVFLEIKAGENAFQKADFNTTSTGPLRIANGKFFLVLPAAFQQFAYWPAIQQGTPMNRIYQDRGNGWQTLNAPTYLSYKVQCRANYTRGTLTRFGAGCRGASNQSVSHTATIPNGNRPDIGTTASYTMTGGRANWFSAFALGGSRTNWNGTRLPLSLNSFGAPGCFVHTSQDVVVGRPTNGSGGASLAVRIPVNTSLVGQSYYTMFTAVVPGRNPLGIATSNGLATRIGGTR